MWQFFIDLVQWHPGFYFPAQISSQDETTFQNAFLFLVQVHTTVISLAKGRLALCIGKQKCWPYLSPKRRKRKAPLAPVSRRRRPRTIVNEHSNFEFPFQTWTHRDASIGRSKFKFKQWLLFSFFFLWPKSFNTFPGLCNSEISASEMLQPRLFGCASDMEGKRNCVWAWSLIFAAVFLTTVTCQGKWVFCG